ncbi:hypothetical protein Syun_027889 [Stephania yunnanensis]|uniref:PEP-utilising enzyme C-terminal domain-containing protein n=1 Tax=Stephania yunnanensis TaxID=152371 RepID=A0AAP0ENN9_9MAGN
MEADTLYMGNICKTWTREQELEHQVSLIRDVSKKVFSEMGTSIGYKIGTMIEIPRAALVADEIAEQVEFFSFGTNDLTQMTFGYSRDDVGKFLPIYLSKGILQHDPFEDLTIDAALDAFALEVLDPWLLAQFGHHGQQKILLDKRLSVWILVFYSTYKTAIKPTTRSSNNS